ncbi:hypothetical protein [Streptomyces sp. A1547]|uniref:hypothetical protein n=1 Tax=Streptomyces sp. A1547 TaxID=2563105 RepID=UPI00109EA29C|nr:hypothetical protein [Streptomyces sp. A1547]THA30541.1 hypothetical protein E6W17_37540 [Streptomyces sp. A1547]
MTPLTDRHGERCTPPPVSCGLPGGSLLIGAVGECTIGTATVVNRLGPDPGRKSSLSQRDTGAQVAEERFPVIGIGRPVRGTRVRVVGGVHGRGECRVAFAALVDHGGGDPDLGRGGGDGQSRFQVVEEGASALGGEAGRPGGSGLPGPEFLDGVAGPRERRIVAPPVTGLASAVEEDLRGEAGRAAESEEPQVLGAVGDAGGADFVGVGAGQEQGEGGVGAGRR